MKAKGYRMKPTLKTIRVNFEAGAKIFRRESVEVLLARIEELERPSKAMTEEEYREQLESVNAQEIARRLDLAEAEG